MGYNWSMSLFQAARNVSYSLDNSVIDVLKIAIPAMGAWLAAYLSNRKERRQWEDKQREEQHKIIAGQADKLASGWVEMTTQAREIINRLQLETIEAKTQKAVMENELINLREELAEVKAKYSEALAEIELLKQKGTRRARQSREETQA